ncbi:hypothetical protein VB773_12375 [Haloarculaceae archaeon H-GB2-1]|nr:hypothetical protein [Haloarculaceae archaeon H-GB2-1]
MNLYESACRRIAGSGLEDILEQFSLGRGEVFGICGRSNTQFLCNVAGIRTFGVIEIAHFEARFQYLALSSRQLLPIDEHEVVIGLSVSTGELPNVDFVAPAVKIVDDFLNGVDIGGVERNHQRPVTGVNVGNRAAVVFDRLADAATILIALEAKDAT